MTEYARLPNGLVFAARPNTSDHNSAIACAYIDEYGVGEYPVAGKPMFDFGAHIGGVGILAAKLGACPVVLVEPVPENAALIRESVKLNHFENSCIVVEAAAGKPGGMEMKYGWSGEGAYGALTGEVHAFVGNTGLLHSGYTPTHVIQVPTVTMQELVDEHGLPFYVKMDCEGGEWALLDEPITKTIPVIIGEYHPWQGEIHDDSPLFADNRAEVARRLEETHDLTFDGPDGCDAGYFRALLR